MFNFILVIFIFSFVFIKNAEACTPIAELVILYGGLTYYLAFLTVIPLKCLLFTYYEKDLSLYQKISYMFFGNIFSTIMAGVMFLPAFSSPSIMIFYIPLIIIMSHLPSKRLAELLNLKKSYATLFNVLIFISITITMLFLGLAKNSIYNSNVGQYWVYKVIYVTISILISTFLTILWEDYAISKLYKFSSKTDRSFIMNVATANIYSLFILSLIGALRTLPERLSTSGFLLIR
jgi:hypothetical protein